METSTIIAIVIVLVSIALMFISGGAKNTTIKLIYIGITLVIYFGSQYLFGQKGKFITLVILICYGAFAWRVKQIGNVVLWPSKD